MNVLMFSIDRALVGDRKTPTDAVERHKRYAERIELLSIIVLTKEGFIEERISDKCIAVPTNSRTRLHMLPDAMSIAKKLFAEARFDVVVAQAEVAPIALRIKRKYRIPLIVSMHAASLVNEDWAHKAFGKTWSLFVKRAMKSADAIRVVSRGVKSQLIKEGMPRTKIIVIPTPVDVQRFAQVNELRVSQIREEWPDRDIILFVGRLESVKNISFLIDVFKLVAAKNDRTHLVVIGEGSERSMLEARVHNAGLDLWVSFIGAKASVELTEYYHAASMFALSSRSESLGKVLIEAASAGLPVVATDTVGAREVIVDGSTGYIVPQGNAKAFADKMVLLLGDKELSTEMGNRALEHVKGHFDREESTTAVVDLWKNVLRKHEKSIKKK